MIAKVSASCGRLYLEVAGICVAMEGDPCRAELPETCRPPIPEEELAQISIGGMPASELPIGIVRFFRRSNWDEGMLQYVANKINAEGEK